MTDRRVTLLVLALLLAVTAGSMLSGCEPGETELDEAEDTAEDRDVEPAPITFGTLPTEDALPLWVAESEGLFEEAGLEVEIQVFQAAQERDAAMTAGAVDCYMGDIIAAALLENGGTPVSITTVMLGAEPDEGRFGILASPGSSYATLEDLAGVPIGTSSGTIQEYVVDSLMTQAGVPAADVVKEEVDKVPVRFELLMNGQLEAAALPEPLLSLGEFQGAVLVADDTGDRNVSQTVMVCADEYLAEAEGAEAMARFLEVWDEAAAIIDEDPDAWRDTLVEKARLPEPIKDTYSISEYPRHQLPAREQVVDVLAWMVGRQLLDEELTYEELVWDAGYEGAAGDPAEASETAGG